MFDQLRVEFPRELYYQQETAFNRRLLADSLKAQGRLPEAVKNYKQAVVLYAGLAADSPDNLWYRVELAFSYSRLGNVFEHSQRTQEAIDAYRQAENLLEKLVQESPKVVDYHKRLAWSQSDLARLLVETKHFPEAELYSRRALDIYKELAAEYPAEPDYWYQMGRQSLVLAQLIQAAGRPGEVKQACEQGLKAFRGALPLYQKRAADSPTPANRYQLADCQACLGETLGQAGQPEEAIKVCRESVSIVEKLVNESNLLEHCCYLATRHDQVGTLLKGLGRHQEAERAYRDALAIWKKLVADHNRPEDRSSLARTQGLLAEVRGHGVRMLLQQRKHAEAAKAAEESLHEFPDDSQAFRDAALVLARCLPIAAQDARLSDVDRKAKAKAYFDRAVQLLDKAFQRNSGNPKAQAELPRSYMSLAETFEQLGRPAEAKTVLDRAIALCEKLPAANPDLAELRQHAASTYRRLGDMLAALEQPQDADKAYDQSLRLWQQLVKKYPEPKHSMTLGYFYWSRARWFAANKRMPEAADAWRSAADVFGALAEKYPKLAFFQQEQGWSYRSLGLMLAAAGDPPQAEKNFRRALDVHKKLVADFPNIAAAAEYRARLGWSYGDLIANLMDQGKKQEAEALAAAAQDLVRDAIKRCPENAEAQNNLVWNLVRFAGPRRCDPAEVVALAKKAVARAPDAPHIVNTLGTAYYRSGDWNAAIDTLMRADELYGGRKFSANAFFIAMAHWQRGEKEQARKWYAPALVWMEKYAPKNDELLRFRAEAAALLGLPERLAPEQGLTKADDLKYYTLVLEAHPKAAWGYAARGILREAAKQDAAAKADYRRALELFTNAVDRAPKAAWPYQQRGTAYARLDHWDKAEADFAKAVELRVDDPVSWYYLALVRLHRGDGDGSRKACTGMLVRFGPSGNANAEYWTTWTCILAPDGVADWTRPVQLAEHLLSTDPNNFLKLNLLGAVLYRAGRFKEAAKRLAEAEAAFEQAKQPQSSIVYGWLFQAMTQHRLGHTADAKRWLEKAVKEIDQPSTEAAVAWNRRVTLDLLRREAEELLRKKSEAKNE